MVRETQTVNSQLSQTQSRSDIRTKVDCCLLACCEINHHGCATCQELEQTLARLALAEEKLAAKERERQDILSNYRAAMQEQERFRVGTVHSSAPDLTALRLQLTAQELDMERAEYKATIRKQQDRMTQVELQLQAVIQQNQCQLVDLRAFEKQNQELARKLSYASQKLEQKDSERGSDAHTAVCC